MIKSPSKFKKHVTKEIVDFLEWVLRDVNVRSPENHIRDALKDIRVKTGGVVRPRLWHGARKITIDISIPTEGFVLELPEEEKG